MTSEAPVIDTESWSDPFSQAANSELAKYLPGYISIQRWYRAKSKSIRQLSIADVLTISEDNYVLILNILYPDESCAVYLLPVGVREENIRSANQEIIATLRLSTGEQRFITNAIGAKDVRDLLLKAISCGTRFPGISGELAAAHTRAFDNICDSLPVLDSAISRAEQSNTSIIYGDRYILKVFRKIEPGINPDLEMGVFLSEHGFKHTPAVLGSLEYRSQNKKTYAVGILQQFVQNQGDAWKYTLDSLSTFFERALARGENRELFELAKQHPLMLAQQQIPRDARRIIGTYLDSAELLGKRTAEMHAVLASPGGGPDFAPEPVSPHDRENMHHAMLSEADIAFETLRRKQPALNGAVAEDAREVLRLEHEITRRLKAFHQQAFTAFGIRHHGDYHLGQVLFTGEDFMIIDFEGEPARPLSERRAKGFAMRDVAGMLRSFQYAAFAALLDGIGGVPGDPTSRHLVQGWASFWNAFISASYLRAYLAEAANSSFVPASAEEQRLLLDAFILQKALYEVSYELNNRPDWVRIPLRGILTLVNPATS